MCGLKKGSKYYCEVTNCLWEVWSFGGQWASSLTSNPDRRDNPSLEELLAAGHCPELPSASLVFWASLKRGSFTWAQILKISKTVSKSKFSVKRRHLQ